MKTKWMAWSVAVALAVTAGVAIVRAQELPVPGGAMGKPEIEAHGLEADDAFAEPDAGGGFDPLLKAELDAESGGPGPAMGMGRGRRAEELRAKLNLTDEQKTRLADIRDRRARAAIPIEGDLRIASLDLNKLMRADKPDQRAIDAQIDKIANLRASLHKNRVAGHLEGRAVLTPAQQKTLREYGGGLMGRAMRDGHRMRGGPRMRYRSL